MFMERKVTADRTAETFWREKPRRQWANILVYLIGAVLHQILRQSM